MIFIGVDPGFHGALAVLDHLGSLLHCVDTPVGTVGTRLEYDRAELKRLLRRLVGPFARRSAIGTTPVACVELVHAMPGQGVVSMWRMGQGFELWMMAFTMLDVAVETVTPQRWKAVLLNGLPKDKDASRYRAKALWPSWAESFSRKKDDGRADACLIAEYLRRQWVNPAGTGRGREEHMTDVTRTIGDRPVETP